MLKFIHWLFLSFIILLFILFFLPTKYLFEKKYIDQSPNQNISNNKSNLALLIASTNYHHNSVYNFFFGKHHRNLWNTPIKVKVLDINTRGNELMPYEVGGNMQTMALKLKDTNDFHYVLRTIDKDQSKALPAILRKTTVGYLVKDQASALHPFSAIVIPHLMKAAGLLHTIPQLVAIPADKHIMDYDPNLTGKLAILEEYPDNSWIKETKFGNAIQIVSTEEMLKHYFKGGGLSCIDARAYLKCRLIDVLINDWDRHSGQWRWAMTIRKGNILFKPIARDRDMAFYKFDDGLLNKMALLINPKLQSFTPDYRNVEALVYNGQYLDRLILSSIPQSEFVTCADSLEILLHDQILLNALQQLPKEIYKINASETYNILQTRRNNLKRAAIIFHNSLQENALIAGTDLPEYYRIIQRGEQSIEVNITTKTKNITKHCFTFHHPMQLEIQGMGGNDTFVVQQQSNSKFKLVLFGGFGDDRYSGNMSAKVFMNSITFIDGKSPNRLGLFMQSVSEMFYKEKEEMNRIGKR